MTKLSRGLLILKRRLTNGGLNEISAHARADYPNECCGMILASGVRPCENIQNDLHKKDPVQFPQSARKAFTIDANETIFLAESFDTNDPVLAVYHSHIDQSAYLSNADKDAALCDGKPAYPHLFHLVIACYANRITEAKLFGFTDGSYHRVMTIHYRDPALSEECRSALPSELNTTAVPHPK